MTSGEEINTSKSRTGCAVIFVANFDSKIIFLNFVEFYTVHALRYISEDKTHFS